MKNSEPDDLEQWFWTEGTWSLISGTWDIFHTITCMGDCRWVFGLVLGFIEHLQIVTTSNCFAIANSRILWFTTALTKSSQSDVPSPNNVVYFGAHILTGWHLTHNCHLSIQLNWLSTLLRLTTNGSWSSLYNLFMDLTENTCSSSYSIVVFTSFGMPMWSLHSHCLLTAIYRVIT
jgi:hypothetical protein